MNPKDRQNLTQGCQRFAIASTSTQVIVLPWRYDEEMGTASGVTRGLSQGGQAWKGAH